MKKIKSATLVNTLMVRKQDRFIANKEEVLVVWIENLTSNNILISQSLIQMKVITFSVL